MENVFIWLLAIVYVEAITEIIIAAEIFVKIRNAVIKRSNFFGKLFSCGYCFSVWMSFSVCWIVPGNVISNLYPNNIYAYLCDCFIKSMAVHRLSNVLHELIKRWLDRYPWVISISSTRIVDNGGPITGEVKNDDSNS